MLFSQLFLFISPLVYHMSSLRAQSLCLSLLCSCVILDAFSHRQRNVQPKSAPLFQFCPYVYTETQSEELTDLKQ